MEMKGCTKAMRWLFGLTLMLWMMIAMSGSAAAQQNDAVTVNSWEELQTKINESTYNNPANLMLGSDIIATNDQIYIGRDKIVTIDLNGKK